MLSQILSVAQTATLLVLADSEKPILEGLVDSLARVKGFPSRQEITADANEGLTKSEWEHFWAYTEAINPYKTVNTRHLPLRTFTQRRPGSSSQLLLY